MACTTPAAGFQRPLRADSDQQKLTPGLDRITGGGVPSPLRIQKGPVNRPASAGQAPFRCQNKNAADPWACGVALSGGEETRTLDLFHAMEALYQN